MFDLHVEKWDSGGYSFLSQMDRKIDLLLIMFGAAEFLVFLVLDSDKYHSIYTSKSISYSLYYGLLLTYLFERLAFGLFKAFFQKRQADIAEGLAVFFLGPHYYYYKSYPYETKKRVLIRQKLEIFGIVVNAIKMALLLYIYWEVQQSIIKSVVVIGILSSLEALASIKDVVLFWYHSPLPDSAKEYYEGVKFAGRTSIQSNSSLETKYSHNNDIIIVVSDD
jgi:hypothetical protein